MNTSNENDLNYGSKQELVLEKTLSFVEAVIAAKGESFVLNNKCILDMCNQIYPQVMNFMNIALGAKNPAVNKNESVHDDYLICLEDGVKVKMLRKYLKKFNMTPQDYMRKWNLPANYPMVAPSYSKQRHLLAMKAGLGLGRTRRSSADKAVKTA